MARDERPCPCGCGWKRDPVHVVVVLRSHLDPRKCPHDNAEPVEGNPGVVYCLGCSHWVGRLRDFPTTRRSRRLVREFYVDAESPFVAAPDGE